MAFLEVKQLKKNFDNLSVLHGVDFSMERGEVVAVIGASGGGKTTFLRCLNFLEMANGGSVTLENEFSFDAEKQYTPKQIRDMRLHMGLVFQSFNLFPQYTALKNVYLPLLLRQKEQAKKRGLSFRERRAYIAKLTEEAKKEAAILLDSVGLSDKKDYYPFQLSGGQQQRVAIARALALKPAILCFDEPTSALDPALTGEVLRVIKGLKEQGRTMLIVTHEMEFAKNVADRVVFFADGRIEEEGPPATLFSSPKSPKTAAFLQKVGE